MRAATPLAGALLAIFAGQALAVTEIIVTTRKREEALQSVPIAVQAITAEDLERRGITDLDGVISQSSSLIIDQGFSPADQRIVIRGLSPTRGRQNVAILVDDIDISSEAVTTAGGSLLINPRFLDVERVEIVKGPQNALYGRSAFAGAINYVTRKPGDDVEAKVGSDIGSDGRLEFTGRVSGPLSDSIKGGFNAAYWNHDGYHDNSVTGDGVGGIEGTTVGGVLDFAVTEDFSVSARVDYLDDEFEASPYTIMPFNATFTVPANFPGAAAGATRNGVRGETPDGDDLRVFVSEDPRTCADPGLDAQLQGGCDDYEGTTREITRATLTLDWDAGPVAFKSLTHLANAETSQVEGPFGVSATVDSAIGETVTEDETDLFSQELRLVSTGDGPISWAVGGLYWNEDNDTDDGAHLCLNYTGLPNLEPCAPYLAVIFDVDPLNPPAGIVPLNPDTRFRDTEHWSLYGLVEWQFLDEWKISFEGRQTWEDTEVGGPGPNPLTDDNGIWDPSGTLCVLSGFPSCPKIGPGTVPPGGPGNTTVAGVVTGSVDDDFFAPKATLTWTPAEDYLYYFSYARAEKPAGISLINGGTGVFDPEASKFKPEKLDVWELGAKTSWLDNRLVVNAAAFYQDFLDKQVSAQVLVTGSGGVPILQGRVVNAGEAEVWGLEIESNWQATDNLSVNLAFTWLDTEYTDYRVFSTNNVKAAYNGSCEPATVGGRNGCYLSYKGNELEDAPELTMVGGGRYQAALRGETDWFVEGDFRYEDSRFDNEENLLEFPSYWLWNFRAGVTNDRWDVLVYVDNAFDDDTVKTGFSGGSVPAFQLTGQFENWGVLIMPDQRQYGMRVGYRFR